MSNKKSWSDPSKGKEQRSIYLTDDDWDYLRVLGNGSQTQAIRDMITSQRDQKEVEVTKNP